MIMQVMQTVVKKQKGRASGAGGTSKLVEVYDHDYSLNYQTEERYWFLKRHDRFGQNQFCEVPPQWIVASNKNLPL